nr:hypothetical protein [Tanacetum cinerariifolium]
MKKDPKEDSVDYPADRGDNENDESSNDDNDDDDVEKDEEGKEEEEHLALADPSDETMTTINQGMSVEEIERVVAQRMANAIEAIAIYETETNLAQHTLLGQSTRRHMLDLYLHATSANFTIVGRALQSAEITRSLRHYKSYKCVDMIHGRVRASKPKKRQDAIEISTKLMNKKISTQAECQTENKKRLDNTSKNNQNQQQPNKSLHCKAWGEETLRRI